MAIPRPDRHRAARMAYRTLLAMANPALPVDVKDIIGRCKNTRLMSYAQAGQVEGLSVYGMVGALPSNQACTVKYEYKDVRCYLVLYNDDVCFGNQGSVRWSLAHELGHIVLGHGTGDRAEEAEANCFAQHLLCPRPVLGALPGDPALIKVAFGVSRQAAAIAARDWGTPCALVDGDMEEAIKALYKVSMAAPMDMLHPAQRVAYQVLMRKLPQW